MAKKKHQELMETTISEYSLPERLRYLRQESRQMSQAALAKESRVSQSTIAQIEKGKKDPSITTLKKIAGALDVHIAVLFATDEVHVLDLPRLRSRYGNVEKLTPALYMALGKVIQYAKDIGFIK